MSVSGKSEPTGNQRDRRKLIAVVYADMEGYSRLIGLDDQGTLSRLRILRRDVIDPEVEEYNGRIVQTGGDSLLIVFDSIIDAVHCMVKIQQQIPLYDAGQPAERRIRFRVGINTGDAIPHGTDLHGEGVNIAARLEAECPVGGICVSRAVHDQVQHLNLPFENIGRLTLKNIARPVEAFALRLDTAATVSKHRPPRLILTAIAASAVGVVAASGGLWWMLHKQAIVAPSLPASGQVETGLAKAPRLSIVILPFVNLSGDPKYDYFAEGMTEDLTTNVAFIPGVFVIARNSAYTYQAKAVDVRKVGEELGVRYALEGSIRKVNDALLRVNAQLISTETGAHLWAEQLDRKLIDVSEGQDEIVRHIAQSLDVTLADVEVARSKRERPTDPDAFDLILRAHSIRRQPFSLDRTLQTRNLLEQAAKLDPTSVRAKTLLATVLIDQYWELPGSTGEDLLGRAATLLAEAESLRPNSERVLALRTYLLRARKRWSEALAVAQLQIDDYPNSEDGYNSLANMKMSTGSPKEAIALFKQALRLDPRSPYLFNRYRRIGYCLILLGRESESIEWLERSLAVDPEVSNEYKSLSNRYMAAAYGLMGQANDAHRVLAEANRLWPYATVRSQFPDDYTSEAAVEQVRHYQEGLRLAGLRDHADEDADFGAVSDGKMRKGQAGQSPKTALGATTIRTDDLISLLQSKPIVIDTMLGTWGRSLPGAVGLDRSGLAGEFSDFIQERLRKKIATLTNGDLTKPIVAVGFNSERFDGYNLSLRLVALGYTKVYWYRGGREMWEVRGLPEATTDVQEW